MNSRSFPSLAAFLFCLCAPAVAAQQPLRIGAWNLEQLGFRAEPLRTEADVQAIADQVRTLGVAVLGVEEIGGEAALQDLCRRIGAGWECLLGTTGGFRDSKDQIGVGFLWDSRRVELLAAEELLDLPREVDGVPIFHRVPVTACFRERSGGPDFRAIVVHMKAGRQAVDDQKRRLEATHLRLWIQDLLARPGEDRDVVVLGDFNHTYGSPPHGVLTDGGLLHYLRLAKDTPTIIHFDEPIDHIAVVPSFREPLPGSFTVHNQQGLRDRVAWRARYSDHFPVTVDLNGGPDDDPEASFAPTRVQNRLPLRLREAALAASRSTPAVTAPVPAAPASPIRAGRSVVVITRNGTFSGVLVEDLPASGTGWVVLIDQNTRLALPIVNVVLVREQ